MKDQIKLGMRAKDRITGFDGIVVAITNWLSGCQRITIQPRALKDGKRIESDTFDIDQLEIIPEGGMAQAEPHKKTKGGPTPEPTRNIDPK